MWSVGHVCIVNPFGFPRGPGSPSNKPIYNVTSLFFSLLLGMTNAHGFGSILYDDNLTPDFLLPT